MKLNQIKVKQYHAIWLVSAVLLLQLPDSNTTWAQDDRPDGEAVVSELKRVIDHEIRDKQIPAFSIALVDDRDIIWAEGFGLADPDNSVPASAETVYRVGSVSKLFTDIAVMQLVEQAALDLDRPVSDYLPEFKPINPFPKPITPRQLTSHRAGLVRESPVGNYFDPSEPSLQAMVASLNETRLVYPPEARTKYSNAAVAVAGYLVQQIKGEKFEDYVQRAVIEPMGLKETAFDRRGAIAAKLAKGYMWTLDGRRFEAPQFLLGTAPAGNLYSSVRDLAQFMSCLFRGGQGPNGQILRPETIQAMWRPQFVTPDETNGFGIGFSISTLDGRKLIGHGGAVYGFATDVAALPKEKIGVAAVGTLDASNTVVQRITHHALKLMLAQKTGKPFPTIQLGQPLDEAAAQKLNGTFRNEQGQTVEFQRRNGQVVMTTPTYQAALRQINDEIVTDDRLYYGVKVALRNDDAVLVQGKTYSRTMDKPAPAPQEWLGLIGAYGWDHNTLYILERDGRLYALIEWFFYYPLTKLGRDVYAFPDFGLYHGEQLVFSRDDRGVAREVTAASVVFTRRLQGADPAETFRITPVRPVDELRRAARQASPPHEDRTFRAPDLVELVKLDPSLHLDIRYATTNNFMSTVFYEQPRAFMQRPAAEALVRASARLRAAGYGLLIHDAYRPWFVTKMFWDATPQDMKIFVANPANGSRHNRGCAVDLTLYELATGRPVTMPSGYDEFTERAYPDYPGGTSEGRWLRRLLRGAMEAEDFQVYDFEWWHFDYKDWREYPILNLPFEDVAP